MGRVNLATGKTHVDSSDRSSTVEIIGHSIQARKPTVGVIFMTGGLGPLRKRSHHENKK